MKTIFHNGRTCYFDENVHQYFIRGQSLISVTTFIKDFFPKFDKENISRKYATKHGLNQQSVLSEWKKKGEESQKRGILLHSYAEKSFIGEQKVESIPEQYQELRQMTDKAVMILTKKYKFIAAEQIVFSAALGIAGTIDLLMRDQADILILDWKYSETLKTENVFQNALDPINHLEDCNMNHYKLQMNLYERILQNEEYFPGARFCKWLIHVKRNNLDWYKVEDMQAEIEKMILKKQRMANERRKLLDSNLYR